MKHNKAILFVLACALICDLGLAQQSLVSRSRSTITVKAGEDLQAAVDAAEYGDTVVLAADATFTGPLILRDKGPGSEREAASITIRTSDVSGISREGERVNPAQHAKSMPKIVAMNGPAVSTAPGAHHYKFIGIEFAPAATSSYVYNLIDLGQSDYSSLAQYPHHLLFDRCYIHSTGLNRARRGIALNSAETSVLNSVVSGFAGIGDETQAIAGWNGPGPFQIINNFLQGGGEVVLFGGADPSIANLVPSDIQIRRNHFHRPLGWQGKATIKGTFELKNARRVIVDGNVLESEIKTTAIVLTVRNQNGKAPWSTLEDINITNNVISGAGSGINILGTDNEQHSKVAMRIRVANNLLTDLDLPEPGNNAYFLQISGGVDISVEHNTVQQTGNIITSYRDATVGFQFRSNIVNHNLYGIFCERGGQLRSCFPAGVFTENVVVDNAKVGSSEVLRLSDANRMVGSVEDIGFKNFRGGDWQLAEGSKFRGKGQRGTDPGADFRALASSGVWQAK